MSRVGRSLQPAQNEEENGVVREDRNADENQRKEREGEAKNRVDEQRRREDSGARHPPDGDEPGYAGNEFLLEEIVAGALVVFHGRLAGRYRGRPGF